jgi:hypothetical protein
LRIIFTQVLGGGTALQLKLDNVKLVYAIDRETGLPTGQAVYVQKEANQLVEEFMLLANITVATRIYKAFPAAAMLRRQPLPLCMSCAPGLVSVAGAGWPSAITVDGRVPVSSHRCSQAAAAVDPATVPVRDRPGRAVVPQPAAEPGRVHERAARSDRGACAVAAARE